MQREEPKAIAGVEHPSHYQSNDRLECIEEMQLMFGAEAVKTFCRLNAYKYYYRAGCKSGESEAIDDILTHYGVIADDNYSIVQSHDGSRVFVDKENPRTEVIIEEVRSVEHKENDGKAETGTGQA